MTQPLPKRILAGLRTLVIVSLITAVVCELGLRVVGFRPYVAEAFIWQHDKLLGWAHQPGAEGTFSKIAFSQSIRINSKGIRERELDYKKPENMRRIVVIGDSMVAGFEVPQEQVLSRVLEDELNKAGGKWQAINGGCRGYGTDQALLWLQGEGLKYQPDIVLYLFNRNDIGDNFTLHRPARAFGKPAYHVTGDDKLKLIGSPVPDYPNMQYLVLDEQGAAQEIAVPASQRATMFLRAHVLPWSSLLTAGVVIVAWASKARMKLKKAASLDQISYESFLSKPHDKKRLAALLVEMKRVTESAGGKFFAIGEDHADFVALVKQANVATLGDKACFWKAKEGEKTIVPFDTHWNARGHELYAKCIHRAMVDAAVVPN